MRINQHLVWPPRVLALGLLLLCFGAIGRAGAEENLLVGRNWNFETWDGSGTSADDLHNWIKSGTASHITRNSDSLVGNYSAQWAPIRTTYTLTSDPGVKITAAGTYHAQVWIKALDVTATNYIRVSLRIANPVNGSYQSASFTDYKEESGWIQISESFSIGTGDLGGIRLSAQRSTGTPKFLIGAAWLGEIPAPLGWPNCRPAPDFPEGFDDFLAADWTVPTGWTFTGITDNYTTSGNFGRQSPSLKFDQNNARVKTPEIAAPEDIYFWLKGQSTDITSSFLVEESSDGTAWSTVTNMVPLPTTGTNFGPLAVRPASIQFQFTYTKSSGNLAFDDVSICRFLTPTPSPKPSATPSPLITPTPSVTPSPTPSATPTPSITPTPSVTPILQGRQMFSIW